ncbi:MAG: lysylphosphatidylglycerol synthase transmembrane domain-containing protein [Acidobacteriaceae bacterium]
MNPRNKRVLWLIALVLIVALVWFGRHHIHFNWTVFVEQIRQADWHRIVLGLACIYCGYILRGYRWARLMRHKEKLPPFSLVGTQVMGFTAVALIGRVADLSRPYLVAKKTGQPLTSQIAVYIVERLFDFGAMGLIAFSVIAFSPAGALPHPEIVRKAGFWGLGLTLAGGLFLLAVRLAGEKVASMLGGALAVISAKAGQAAEKKIRTFHAGLDTIRTFSDFAIVGATSLIMWMLIALAYLLTLRAFIASPPLAAMTPARAVLLMIFSGGVSALQLPILGWFTQIGFVAAAIGNFFGASPEASLGCAAALLLVTFLGIVPVGLAWARFDRVSLIKVVEESEHAGEALAHHAPEEPARRV